MKDVAMSSGVFGKYSEKRKKQQPTEN